MRKKLCPPVSGILDWVGESVAVNERGLVVVGAPDAHSSGSVYLLHLDKNLELVKSVRVNTTLLDVGPGDGFGKGNFVS